MLNKCKTTLVALAALTAPFSAATADTNTTPWELETTNSRAHIYSCGHNERFANVFFGSSHSAHPATLQIVKDFAVIFEQRLPNNINLYEHLKHTAQTHCETGSFGDSTHEPPSPQ